MSILLAALVLSACNPSGKYNPSDARTFGLTGDVMEVFQTDEILFYSEGDVDESWADEGKVIMTFDETGRVTLDPYGNEYRYDESGNFIGGNVPRTVMTRDLEGRIETYDNTDFEEYESDDFDVMSYFDATYYYDAKNRLEVIDYSGWEFSEHRTYSYEGDKVYPVSAVFENGSSGWNENGEIKYEYTSFDARGNWTERKYTKTIDGWEDPMEEGMEPGIEKSEIQGKETRTIKYWSDQD